MSRTLCRHPSFRSATLLLMDYEDVPAEVRERRIQASRSAARGSAQLRRLLADQPKTVEQFTGRKPDNTIRACGFWVYVLRGEGRCILYIGQSRNVLNRLGRHMVAPDRAHLVRSVDVFECADAIEMSSLEARLIRYYKPPLNKALTEREEVA